MIVLRPPVERPPKTDVPDSPEVLIREARRRRHRRWAVAITVMVVALSASWVGYESSGSGTRTPQSKAPVPAHPRARASGTKPRASSPAPPTPPPRLVSVAYFNPTSGYGLFEETLGGFCEMAVAETADGGATFPAPVPVGPCNRFGGTTTARLSFDDHGDGFLYGPTLFETHDGGASWAPDPQPGLVLSVESLGDSIWMLEAGCAQLANPAGKAPCPLQVYESTDGGRTWTQSAALPPSATSSRTGRGGSVSGRRSGSMVRAGTTSAYVVGSPPTSGQSLVRTVPGTVPLSVTTDGGHTWVQRTIPCGTDDQQAMLSAAPTGTLIAVCGRYTQITGHVEEKAVLTSTDGGASWSEVTTCNPLQGTHNCALGDGYLSSVDAVTASDIYVIGTGGNLVGTTDGGNQWSTEPVADGSGGGNPSVVFFNPSDGFVVTQTAFWRTANAGLSWSKVAPVVQASPPAPTATHLGTAALPSPLGTAARVIQAKTAVPIEAPSVLPPSLSAKATVSRTHYAVSLYECPAQLRFGTPAIGEGSCAGSAHEFGSFSGEQEASAGAARAVTRTAVTTPPGCPAGRKLIRRRTDNVTAVQEETGGTVRDCAFTWTLGQWTVELHGDVTSFEATEAEWLVRSEFAGPLSLPKAPGVLVIHETASTYHVLARWSRGSTVYGVTVPAAYPDVSSELPLISVMVPVAKP